ncbi:MAG: DUF2442 domain-containing protein [Caldilineaceae bacterium]|nr:DUF2442 domain-containing protein [Caldilineaceae bacterium]
MACSLRDYGWYLIAAKCTYRCPGTDTERANWRLIGNGVGIHWPGLDEDIGVEGLVLGKRSRESEASLAGWVAKQP